MVSIIVDNYLVITCLCIYIQKETQYKKRIMNSEIAKDYIYIMIEERKERNRQYINNGLSMLCYYTERNKTLTANLINCVNVNLSINAYG